MDTTMLTHIALGLALSACAGFRVFIPMLAAAIAGKFNIISLGDMQWLASYPAIICFFALVGLRCSRAVEWCCHLQL